MQLETASQGWFEDEEDFQKRLQASERAWMAKLKQANSKKKKPASSTASAWSTAPTRQKASGGTKKAAKPKPKAKGGNVFAAMMMDSDSD
ncbi:expressed unknown protein [Seminavis robusta]|uniref:Uncharacterized protein n=1 Tax=Seminavis robusta TaxID=568900 RepID=A0A9N8EB09_9STRA|nr:expressed unknown protein [Seminavis robusta]|eukprot:Sro864_g212560.1 n/a (90) ;mRNA; r:4318-4698